MSERILICVAWPYANGSLHVGQIAGAYLPADIFARYHRLKGNEVLMVSGSDQHGTPITIKAEQEGKQPGEIADFYHQEFLDVNEEIGFTLYLPPAHTMVGFAHYEMEEPEKALKHFEKAQAIAEEVGAQHPLAEALFGLGLVKESKGDISAALRYFERALTVAKPISLRPVIQAATNRIEELSKKKGQAG